MAPVCAAGASKAAPSRLDTPPAAAPRLPVRRCRCRLFPNMHQANPNSGRRLTRVPLQACQLYLAREMGRLHAGELPAAAAVAVAMIVAVLAANGRLALRGGRGCRHCHREGPLNIMLNIKGPSRCTILRHPLLLPVSQQPAPRSCLALVWYTLDPPRLACDRTCRRPSSGGGRHLPGRAGGAAAWRLHHLAGAREGVLPRRP